MPPLRVLLIIFLSVIGVSVFATGADLPARYEEKGDLDQDALVQEIDRMWAAEDYAGIEKIGAKLREDRRRFANSYWWLDMFYGRIIFLRKGEEEKAIERYERWAKESPESITAQVCYARALVTYAWRARGSGWASTVTDEGWRLFDERLQKAQQVIDNASKLKETCPHLFAVQIYVAKGLGWDRAKFHKALEEAIEKEPTYGTYYPTAMTLMLPRWYGSPGEFEAWMAELTAKQPEKDQDRYYAWLLWMADKMREPEELVFAEGRLDWQRAKRGFEKWMVWRPGDFSIVQEYARLAVFANDRDAAREAFDILGGSYSDYVWDNDPNFFEDARKFAYEDGPNPAESFRNK